MRNSHISLTFLYVISVPIQPVLTQNNNQSCLRKIKNSWIIVDIEISNIHVPIEEIKYMCA